MTFVREVFHWVFRDYGKVQRCQRPFTRFFLLKVNEYQAKIKDTTRKMMALVSELSMNQAAAMKLQQEVKSKEQELEQSYVRMEKGEAPNEEAEREWLRMIRDEARREKELTERKQVQLVLGIKSSCYVVVVSL